jgi:tetratricopeptide (TPR) repeat protein
MSAELDRIRARLCSTSTLLQQHKQLAAVLAVHEAVHGLQRLRPGMSTPECTEIERLTERSIGLLSSSPDTTTLSLLPLEYVSGKEDDLLDRLRTILESPPDPALQEARSQLEALDRDRQQLLESCLSTLDCGDAQQAKQLFNQLIEQYGGGTELKVEISERFLKKGQEEIAWEYLEKADMDNPSSVHLFNRMGNVLRRLQRYREAEANFLKAMEKADQDENLLFNLGRVYIDWQQWENAIQTAQKALALRPGFDEARSMLSYAQSKLEPASG